MKTSFQQIIEWFDVTQTEELSNLNIIGKGITCLLLFSDSQGPPAYFGTVAHYHRGAWRDMYTHDVLEPSHFAIMPLFPLNGFTANLKVHERFEKVISTLEDWCPTVDMQVKVFITLLSDGVTYRVAVWGGDDFGLEFDTPNWTLAKHQFDSIINFTTQEELRNRGFVSA